MSLFPFFASAGICNKLWRQCACMRQKDKRDSDTAQWLADSLRHFTCLFVCCEKKVRARSSENLGVLNLRVFASYLSASPVLLGPNA